MSRNYASFTQNLWVADWENMYAETLLRNLTTHHLLHNLRDILCHIPMQIITAPVGTAAARTAPSGGQVATKSASQAPSVFQPDGAAADGSIATPWAPRYEAMLSSRRRMMQEPAEGAERDCAGGACNRGGGGRGGRGGRGGGGYGGR